MWKKKFLDSARIFISSAAIMHFALPAAAENFVQSVQSPKTESILIKESIRLDTRRPKVALVLGGGGLRGAAHVGILRVLEREGIPIDMVVGTSMGAVVGGLYCAGVTTDSLEKNLVRKFISSFYNAPLPVQMLKMNASFLMLRKPQGLYDGASFANCINDSVPAQQREISNLHPQFAAVTTDLVEGRTKTLTQGDLGRALQASTAIPILRKPVSIGDALLVDGGTICNLPVDQAKQLGADFVIAVDVDEKIESKARRELHHRMTKTSARVLNLVLAKIDEQQRLAADVCIQPDVTGISLLSRSGSDGERAMLAGEDAAAKAMPELKRKLMQAGVELHPSESLITARKDSASQNSIFPGHYEIGLE